MHEEKIKTAILPQNPTHCQSKDWKQVLTQAIQDETTLHKYLHQPIDTHFGVTFPIKIPRQYLNLIDPGNPNDPLLKQVLPQPEEDIEHPDFSTDPTKDLEQQPLPGLLHKYPGRVLLITTGACAIHCRYCFRRHYPYNQNQTKASHWHQIMAYLKQTTDVSEVIFSGGDPFTLTDDKLIQMLDNIQTLPHIDTIRFHTRMLCFIPERVTGKFEQWLKSTDRSIVMVYHINHGNEISPAFGQLTQKLQAIGVTQLNQSVLLKSINDQPDILAALSRKLFKTKILPYYLHQLDPVQGAAHFQVPLAQAKQIHLELKNQLPGYLTPKLVFEQPHAHSKQWLC